MILLFCILIFSSARLAVIIVKLSQCVFAIAYSAEYCTVVETVTAASYCKLRPLASTVIIADHDMIRLSQVKH